VFYSLTTQEGVVVEPREAERSQGLVKFLVRTAFRGEPLFRSSRPDFIETPCPDSIYVSHVRIVPVFQTGLH